MRALIFGASGQDGQYLSRLLRHEEIGYVGVSRSGPNEHGDVADFDFVSDIVRKERPTHVFHFAANSITHHDALFENHRAITTGTVNILEASRLWAPRARIFLSGSALQLANKGDPIDETAAPAPSSAYAVARIQSLFSARYFRDAFGMAVYFGYFFNHDSELRSSRHVNMRILETAYRISCGSKEKLALGDPTVRKEFAFAGDTMRAVWTLVNQDSIFEVVLGSGQAHSIQEWADLCFRSFGLNAREHIVPRPDYRPEYRTLVSAPHLIRSLGWSPKVDLEGLLDVMRTGISL
jgi:GDPmannose 4,6-dehydratase